MDYLKRKLGKDGETFEVMVTPISLTLVPPPAVAVNVFIQITREQKNNFVSRKYVLEPGQQAQRKKITFNGEHMKLQNDYQQKKQKSPQPNVPVQWQEKEVFISVLSEGVGGKVQTIGTQKINLSNYVAQYLFNPAQPNFTEVIPFPPAGLVGDLEVSIFLRHLSKPSQQPNLPPQNQPLPAYNQNGLQRAQTFNQPQNQGYEFNQQQPALQLAQNSHQIPNQQLYPPVQANHLPPQQPLPIRAAEPTVDVKYTFIPKYLSFQSAQVRPQRASIRLKDGTAQEKKTGDYWILAGSLPDPRMSREQNESSLSELVPHNNEDMNVSFQAETLSGVVQVVKTASPYKV